MRNGGEVQTRLSKSPRGQAPASKASPTTALAIKRARLLQDHLLLKAAEDHRRYLLKLMTRVRAVTTTNAVEVKKILRTRSEGRKEARDQPSSAFCNLQQQQQQTTRQQK